MRPIRLTMQAFGPYAGTQVLDMEALGKTGIYAITGETGAGKTTIFDAIVYALFGTGSGEDRPDGKGMRAVAASPALETRVELSFICGGKTYAIVRRPAQTLAGKRKETVDRVASQELTLPDGRVITKNDEIKERIEKDILGVSKDQFCQIVMIAQGEFRKLLRADTTERTEIMRRIFKTERFNALGERAMVRCREKREELKSCRDLMRFSLTALRAYPASGLDAQLKALQAVAPEALLPEDAVGMADRIGEADEAEHRAAAGELERAEQARDAAREAHERALGQQRMLKERAERLEELGALERRSDAAARTLQEARERQPEAERLGREIVTRQNQLEAYGRLDALERTRAALDGELEKQDRLKKEAEAERARQAGIRDALTAEAESRKDAPDRRLRAKDALNAARERGEKLEALNRRIAERDSAQQALAAQTAAAEQARGAELEAGEALGSLERELEALGNTALALGQLQDRRERLAAEAEENEALRKLCAQYDEARERHGAARLAFGESEAAWQRLDDAAKQLRRRYNANIAGILATGLSEGEPCPVCGSIHHPRPAALSEAEATEDAVERAEARAEAAKQRYNELAGDCRACEATVDGFRGQLAARLFGMDEARWPDEIERRVRENRAAGEANTAALSEAEAKDARHRALVDSGLPAAREALKAAEGARTAAERALEGARTRLSQAGRELDSAAAGVMPEDWTALDVNDAIAENAAQQKEQARALERAQADVERLDAIGIEQAAVAEAIRAAEAAVHAAELAGADLSAKRRKCGEDVDALRRELPFGTEAECRAAIREMEGEKQAIEGAVAAARDAVADLGQQIAGAKGALEKLEADLKGAPPMDADALEQAYREAHAAWKAAAEREKAIHTRRANNDAQRRSLREQAGRAQALAHEYDVMQGVCNTIRGSGGGMHFPLETYVQTTYFDRIIDYANRRLYQMSRHQYDLVRREFGDGSGGGKKGLDLDVLDHANGKRRAVGTLSGGESFLASLSFALGMSDAIQASAASAVQIDTMFVDEGFGSLSESFLSLVMDELNATANTGRRLIGIISHVDEVKEGVERRIEVTKDHAGVSTARIC